MKIFSNLKYTPFYNFVHVFYSRFAKTRWILTGENLPIPHLVKEDMIRQCGLKYNLKTLVETGTYLGTMVDAVKDDFDKIYSIELDDKLYQLAKRKFWKFPHIHLFKGDSGKVLPKVLNMINSPTLFWLDAHYSGGITAKSKTETPILEELKHILSHQIKRHVILIDDSNLFNGESGYPTQNLIKVIARNRNSKMKVDLGKNIIVIVGST